MSLILMTTLFYKALILQGEIWCWSFLGLKGLIMMVITTAMTVVTIFSCSSNGYSKTKQTYGHKIIAQPLIPEFSGPFRATWLWFRATWPVIPQYAPTFFFDIFSRAFIRKAMDFLNLSFCSSRVIILMLFAITCRSISCATSASEGPSPLNITPLSDWVWVDCLASMEGNSTTSCSFSSLSFSWCSSSLVLTSNSWTSCNSFSFSFLNSSRRLCQKRERWQRNSVNSLFEQTLTVGRNQSGSLYPICLGTWSN